MNSKVHTGAKSQLGGLKEGLFKVLYQSLTELLVKKDPKNPIIKGIKIEIISLT
jgi:hypothetical protein